MCGRFTSTATTDELMRRFGVTILQNLRPRWNIAPNQNTMVLVRDGLHLQAKTAAWWLPPTGSNKSFLINARMETVREKPTFRDAFSLSRCIVVASWPKFTIASRLCLLPVPKCNGLAEPPIRLQTIVKLHRLAGLTGIGLRLMLARRG